jgi:hypothetical protein
MAKACPALATAVMLVARAASGTGDGSVGVTKSEVFSGRGVLVPTSHTTAMQVQVVPVVRESSHQSTANHRVADERSWPHSPPTNWSTVPTFYFATVKATTDATSGGVVIPPETLAFSASVRPCHHAKDTGESFIQRAGVASAGTNLGVTRLTIPTHMHACSHVVAATVARPRRAWVCRVFWLSACLRALGA